MDRPNVVLIHCHDLGRHLGCYGRGVETPHVDAIADEGLRFDECYCTAPQCSPSRASMHTGMYPHEVGMLGLHNRGWRLDEGVRLLPEYFADAGYGTRLYGFQHVVDRTDAGMARSGYGEWDTATTRAREVADRFAADLDGSAEPFLATLGFTEPHLPYDRDYVDEEWYDRYDPDDVEPLPYLPDVEAVRRDLADCYGLLSGTVDRAVGRVDAALHGAGIADETLVVFTADHGIALPRAKGSLADPGIETGASSPARRSTPNSPTTATTTRHARSAPPTGSTSATSRTGPGSTFRATCSGRGQAGPSARRSTRPTAPPRNCTTSPTIPTSARTSLPASN